MDKTSWVNILVVLCCLLISFIMKTELNNNSSVQCLVLSTCHYKQLIGNELQFRPLLDPDIDFPEGTVWHWKFSTEFLKTFKQVLLNIVYPAKMAVALRLPVSVKSFIIDMHPSLLLTARYCLQVNINSLYYSIQSNFMLLFTTFVID